MVESASKRSISLTRLSGVESFKNASTSVAEGTTPHRSIQARRANKLSETGSPKGRFLLRKYASRDRSIGFWYFDSGTVGRLGASCGFHVSAVLASTSVQGAFWSIQSESALISASVRLGP